MLQNSCVYEFQINLWLMTEIYRVKYKQLNILIYEGSQFILQKYY